MHCYHLFQNQEDEVGETELFAQSLAELELGLQNMIDPKYLFCFPCTLVYIM